MLRGDFLFKEQHKGLYLSNKTLFIIDLAGQEESSKEGILWA